MTDAAPTSELSRVFGPVTKEEALEELASLLAGRCPPSPVSCAAGGCSGCIAALAAAYIEALP